MGRRQSKTLSTIDERRSKIDGNSVFDCHMSPVWRQMAIKNSVSNDFLSMFLDCIGVFDCRLPGVVIEGEKGEEVIANNIVQSFTRDGKVGAHWITCCLTLLDMSLCICVTRPDVMFLSFLVRSNSFLRLFISLTFSFSSLRSASGFSVSFSD